MSSHSETTKPPEWHWSDLPLDQYVGQPGIDKIGAYERLTHMTMEVGHKHPWDDELWRRKNEAIRDLLADRKARDERIQTLDEYIVACGQQIDGANEALLARNERIRALELLLREARRHLNMGYAPPNDVGERIDSLLKEADDG